VAIVNKAIAVHISPALCTPITPFPADPICSQRVTVHCQWGKKPPNCPFPWDFVILPQEDRATAIGNMHRKIGKDRACWFRRYPGGQTDRQTCSSVITILRHSVKTFVTTQVNSRVLLSCYSCRAAIYRSVDDFGTLFSFSAAAILSPTLTLTFQQLTNFSGPQSTLVPKFYEHIAVSPEEQRAPATITCTNNFAVLFLPLW